MKTLILNGSPKTTGTVATLLKLVKDKIENSDSIEWINVYDLSMKPCNGCMNCRQAEKCFLPVDDGHRIGEKIKNADNLIIGTPTYWGSMSVQLKMLLERNVPVFMGDGKNGMPTPRQKGKKAAIVAACTTPFPFNFLLSESRGAVSSVKHILKYGGYKIAGVLVKPGTKKDKTIRNKEINKASKLGLKF